MRERVRGYADAIFEASGSHIGSIADELRASTGFSPVPRTLPGRCRTLKRRYPPSAQ